MYEQNHKPLTCEQVREKMFELYHGELSKGESEAMQAHIASCPGCQREYANIEKTIQYIRSCVQTPEKSIAESVSRQIHRPFYRHPYVVRFGSLAAAFVLIVGAVLAFGPSMKRAAENMSADSAELQFFGMEEAAEETVCYDMASNGGFSYSASDDAEQMVVQSEGSSLTGRGETTKEETSKTNSSSAADSKLYAVLVTSAAASTAVPMPETESAPRETAAPAATMAPATTVLETTALPATTALPETTALPVTTAAVMTQPGGANASPAPSIADANPIRYREQTAFGPADGWQNFGRNGEIRTVIQPLGSTVVYSLYSYFIRNGFDVPTGELPSDASALASRLTEKDENGKRPLWESMGASPDSVSLTASSPLYGAFPLICRAEYTLTEDSKQTQWIVYLLTEEEMCSAFAVRVNSSYDTVLAFADSIAGSYRPLSGDGEDDLSGIWYDTNSKRCMITAEKAGEAYNITAHWSSSVSEASEWTMSARYDEDTASYRYTDGVRKTVVTDETGKRTETVVYKNGSGAVWVHNGFLYWTDDIDKVRNGFAFERYES